MFINIHINIHKYVYIYVYIYQEEVCPVINKPTIGRNLLTTEMLTFKDEVIIYMNVYTYTIYINVIALW
jgi:hypothetical protein